jgi:hypothetical protein
MAQENVGINITVGGNQDQALGSLKKQLREAQQDVQALSDKFGATSKEAVQAAKRAGELKDRIGDAKDLVAAFNPDAKFKSLTASLSGVAGGFAAVQGGIALFGVESKEVEKTLLKVQSAMALSQGLQAVGESIDSFKNLGTVIKNSTIFLKANELANKAAAITMKLFGVSVEATSISFKVLKTAIISTGIGILVVALGEAVSMFQNFSSAAEDAAEKQKQFNDAVAKRAKVGLKAEQEFLDNQQKIDIAKAKSRGASEKEIFNLEQNYRKSKIQSQSRYYEEVKNADKDAAEDALSEIKKANTEGQVAQLEFNSKQLQTRRDFGKKSNDEAKQQREQDLKDRLEAEKEAQIKISELRETIFLNTFADENAKKIAELNIAYNKERDTILNNTLLQESTKNELIKNLRVKLNIDLDAIKKEQNDKQIADDAQMLADAAKSIEAQDELDFNKLKKDFAKTQDDEKKAAAKELADIDKKILKNTTDLELEKSLLDEKDALIKEQFANSLITEEQYNAALEANSKARKDIDKEEADAKVRNAEIASQLLGTISDIVGKNTAAGKAAAIASTTIDTYLSAQKAYASQLIPGDPSSPIRAAIAAGIAVVGGIKNVKSILAVKTPGGGGGGAANISAPNVSATAPIAPPQPQAQTTSLNTQTINALGNQAARAYVVESDVTSSQQRMAAIQQRARFG